MKLSLNSAVLWALFLVPALLLTTPNGSVAVIALVSLFSVYFMLKNRQTLQVNSFDKLVIACLSGYFIIYIPTVIADGTTLRYFQGGLRLLLCIPIFILFSRRVENISALSIKQYLIWGVIVGSFGALAISIYQYFILHFERVDGFLYSINFGYLATALFCISSSLALFSAPFRLWLITAALASLIATFLTFTRGAIFAIPLLVILGILLNWKRIRITQLLAVFLALCVSSLLTYHYSLSFKQRIDFTVHEFSNIEKGHLQQATSTGTRLYLWRAAIEAYKQNPLIGLSYKQREILNNQLYKEGKVNEYTRDLPRGHAHNQYFEMLASTGSLSLIGIFMMLLLPFGIFVKHYWQTQSAWGFTGALFVAGFILFGLTEVPLQANAISSFYGFMLATFFALVRNEKHNTQDSHKPL